MKNKELTPLEAYENLCSHLDYDSDDYMFNGNYEEDNEIVIKALTALEIIKEKEVCIYLFIGCDNVKQYNNSMDLFEMPKKDRHKYHLTQEQFDLLKEVLSDAK